MKRPTVTLNCNADRYADRRCERIIEFEGGLISFRSTEEGGLRVSLYQLDANVSVSVDPHFLSPGSQAA